MAYTPQMAYSLDKEADLFGPGFIEPSNDFFDQFLTFDSVDNDNSVYPVLDNSTDLEKALSVSESAGTSSRGEDIRSEFLERSRADVWDYELLQNPLTPQVNPSACNNFQSDNSRRASRSDSDLLSLEGISLHSPQITPLSPSLPTSPKSPVLQALPVLQPSPRRRDRFVDSISKTLSIPKLRKTTTPASEAARSPIRKPTLGSPTRKVTLGSPTRKVTAAAIPEPHRLSPQRSPTRSPTRKTTSPAKMMRASQYTEQSLQEWQNRLQSEASKFDFGFQNPQPLSPPPSARVSDASESSSHMMATSNSQESAFTWDQPVPQYGHRSHDVHTPLATPVTGYSQQSNHNLSNSGLIYPNNQQPSWQHSQAESDYNPFIASSPYIQDDGPPIWWSHASTAPLTQASPAVYHRNSEDTKNLALQLQSELVYNASELALSPNAAPQGLMIQLPHSPVHQSFVVPSPHSQHPLPSYFPPHQSQNGPPVIRQTPQHRYTQSQPMSHTIPRQFSSPQMRKSRSRGDMSEPPSPTSRATSFNVQKSRSRTVSATRATSRTRRKSEHYTTTPRTPKSPRKNAQGGGFADFVNFTPDDSGKILTGVAPSGSSKTKARREKEAMEKRRRLSQAAMRAVQAAGGSIESLVEEGLLV